MTTGHTATEYMTRAADLRSAAVQAGPPNERDAFIAAAEASERMAQWVGKHGAIPEQSLEELPLPIK